MWSWRVVLKIDCAATKASSFSISPFLISLFLINAGPFDSLSLAISAAVDAVCIRMSDTQSETEISDQIRMECLRLMARRSAFRSMHLVRQRSCKIDGPIFVDCFHGE
jgi:hypothetical protein